MLDDNEILDIELRLQRGTTTEADVRRLLDAYQDIRTDADKDAGGPYGNGYYSGYRKGYEDGCGDTD